MRPLSEHQVAILDYLWSFIDSLGESPNMREIEEGSGVSDNGNMAYRLRTLQFRGFLEMKRDRVTHYTLFDGGATA